MTCAAYIALGSNLGDSRRLLAVAARQLAALSQSSLAISSLWRTAPVDCPPGSPDFLNAVARIEPRTALPEELLAALQALERALGRRPKQIHNEARPVDLDLIAFGDVRMNTPQLVLPHPRAHQRLFVLAPLAELAPRLVLPGQTESVSTLLARVQDHESGEIIRRVDTPEGGWQSV